MSVFRDIEDMQSRGYDPSTIAEAHEWNAKWECLLASPIGRHLRYGDDDELWDHPDGPFLDMDEIARRVTEIAPDGYLFEFGMLPVWSSIGGNAIAYDPETKAFYWADHTRIYCDEHVELPETYEQLPLTRANLFKAMLLFSTENCSVFLRELHDGVHDARIDDLD